MSAALLRSIAGLGSLLCIGAACVQKPPARLLQRDGYSAGELNGVNRRGPEGLPVLQASAWEFTEWEEGLFRLELRGEDATRLYEHLSVEEELHPSLPGAAVKRGVHLNCFRKRAGTRCVAALSLPGGKMLEFLKPERVRRGQLPLTRPFRSEALEIREPEAGGIVTLIMRGSFAERVRDGFSSSHADHHLDCDPPSLQEDSEPTECRLRVDPRDASALFPKDGR
jgi:hypothetical protein